MDLLDTVNKMQCLETDSNAEEIIEETLTNDDNNFKSQFAHLYKSTSTISQTQRREKLLQSLKERRYDAVDAKRDFSELFEDLEGIDFNLEDEVEPMEVVKKQRRRRRRRRKSKVVQNKLMNSEWFSEIPIDLETNWLFKLCPEGVRNLVVSYNCTTQAFNKKGRLQSCFSSYLPGGGSNDYHNRFTVLDCVYNRKHECYFVLDILVWNGYSLMNSNTEMRFFWLRSKMAENPQLKERNLANPFPFCETNFYPAEVSVIEEKLSQPYDFDGDGLYLDGILFYHREIIYIEGTTPLVGWLRPYMIPEMLNIPISDFYMKNKPKDYTSLQQYLNNKKHRKTNAKAMEMMDC